MLRCRCIRPTYKTEGMEITVEGEYPDGLYIVRFGLVSVYMHKELLYVPIPVASREANALEHTRDTGAKEF